MDEGKFYYKNKNKKKNNEKKKSNAGVRHTACHTYALALVVCMHACMHGIYLQSMCKLAAVTDLELLLTAFTP